MRCQDKALLVWCTGEGQLTAKTLLTWLKQQASKRSWSWMRSKGEICLFIAQGRGCSPQRSWWHGIRRSRSKRAPAGPWSGWRCSPACECVAAWSFGNRGSCWHEAPRWTCQCGPHRYATPWACKIAEKLFDSIFDRIVWDRMIFDSVLDSIFDMNKFSRHGVNLWMIPSSNRELLHAYTYTLLQCGEMCGTLRRFALLSFMNSFSYPVASRPYRPLLS